MAATPSPDALPGLAVLEQTPIIIEKIVWAANDEQLHWKPAPDRWSISEVLAQLGLPEMKYSVDETVTYHDACHLAHAQKLKDGPRELLSRIPGLTLVPLAESDLCCGAAGTYNLEHPREANELADRKLDNVAGASARPTSSCAMAARSSSRCFRGPISPAGSRSANGSARRSPSSGSRTPARPSAASR